MGLNNLEKEKSSIEEISSQDERDSLIILKNKSVLYVHYGTGLVLAVERSVNVAAAY